MPPHVAKLDTLRLRATEEAGMKKVLAQAPKTTTESMARGPPIVRNSSEGAQTATVERTAAIPPVPRSTCIAISPDRHMGTKKADTIEQ